MKLSKRAVSPLIATIMLIALTVAIGALIIGWGKGYVEKQTSCMGYSADIYDAVYDSTHYNITLKVANTGSNKITYTNNLFAVIIDTDGNKHMCGIGTTTWSLEGCKIAKLYKGSLAFPITPSQAYRAINITIDSKNVTWYNSVQGGQVYLMVKGCGRISPQVMIS